MSLSVEMVKSIRIRQKRGIPKHVRKKVITHIVDTIGISLAAYKGAPVAIHAIKGVSLGNSSGAGRVIGSNIQLPPAQAAFANTALAHALDYDDIHDFARVHPTPIMLATAFAAANINENKKIDIVEAVAIGNELLCRLGYALEPKGTGADSNWFLTQLFGYVGATLTAGLILDLSDTQLIHALGIAYMQAAGGKEPGVGVGSTSRAIYPAFASMGGVHAACLAKAGVTAPKSSLDGKAGLFKIYLGDHLNGRQKGVVLDTESWAFLDTSIKLYPSCRYSHPYIQAALKLSSTLNYKDIKEIEIRVNETANILCTPFTARCNPHTLQDAKFSLPFLVAFAFVHGEVHLNNLNEQSLKDNQVLALTKLIKIKQSQSNKSGLPLGDIQVKTDKKTYKSREPFSNKVSLVEVKNKFIQCCKFSSIANPELLWEVIYSNVDYHLMQRLPTMGLDEELTNQL